MQSLEDEIKFSTADLEDAKKGIAESSEISASAQGDLDVTSKEVAEDTRAREKVIHTCETSAATYAAETKSRDEELQTLAQAKAAIIEATGGAALEQASFIQLARARMSSKRDLHSYEAVRLVRNLANQQRSKSLAQLASQMSAAMQSSGAFDKVKGLISAMIARLEKEAGADATKKAYCDKELAESNEKKTDKTNEIEKISTRIDRAAAASAQLKEEVVALQSELAKLAKTQAAMDNLRREQKAAFDAAQAELQKGITGLRQALKILNDYYGVDGKAHEAAEGSASGIISLLETCEADFSKNLAQTMKEQSVKYKVKDSKSLDKTLAELTSDRNGVQAELDAVSEYLSKIEAACIAKAETFAARAARFAAEIAGLKDALQILESETSLVQTAADRKTLRGTR